MKTCISCWVELHALKMKGTTSRRPNAGSLSCCCCQALFLEKRTLRVLESLVPGVAVGPGKSEAAALAAASMPRELQAAFAAEAVLEEAYPTGAEVASSQRRQLLLWMHRLPSYRTRLQQILGNAQADRPAFSADVRPQILPLCLLTWNP